MYIFLEMYKKEGCRQQNKACAKEAGSGLFCQTALIKIWHWWNLSRGVPRVFSNLKGGTEQNYILCDSVGFGAFPWPPVLSVSEFRLLNLHICVQSLWSLCDGVRAILSPIQPPACLWGFLSRLQALERKICVMDSYFHGLSLFYCVTLWISRKLPGEADIKELWPFGKGLAKHHTAFKCWVEWGVRFPTSVRGRG